MFKKRPPSRDRRRRSVRTNGAEQAQNPYSEMKEVRPQHLEIARLSALGMPPRLIAKELKMTPEAVGAILNNTTIMPGVIESYQVSRDESVIDIRRQIERIAPNAIKLLEEAINYRPGDMLDDAFEGIQPSVSDQIRAANIVLDKSVSDKSLPENPAITTRSILLIKERALQAKDARKDLSDAEDAVYEEIPQDNRNESALTQFGAEQHSRGE